MMRKLSLFLILFLLSIIPLASASFNTAAGTAQINTKLTAGTFTGTFVGFSSTSHDTAGGLKPITVLNLDLDPKTPTAEIIKSDKMTASGSFYAYWIVRNNTNAMKISLSWTVPDGISITVNEYTSEKTTAEIVTVDASTSVTTGSKQISVKTGDLLDKTYGASYTIVFKIKAEAQS